MAKRNQNKLSLTYDKRQKDFVVNYPRKPDGYLILYHLLNDILRFDLNKSLNKDKSPYNIYNFKKELEDRGYDLKTLKFSIELKTDKNNKICNTR